MGRKKRRKGGMRGGKEGKIGGGNRQRMGQKGEGRKKEKKSL